MATSKTRFINEDTTKDSEEEDFASDIIFMQDI